MPSDVGEEELEAVGGTDHGGGLGCGRCGGRRASNGRLGLLASACADLDSDRLELALKLLGLVVGKVVLESEGLELGRLEEATLLGALDEDARRLRLKKLSHLVLRQERFTNPFFLLLRLYCLSLLATFAL